MILSYLFHIFYHEIEKTENKRMVYTPINLIEYNLKGFIGIANIRMGTIAV